MTPDQESLYHKLVGYKLWRNVYKGFCDCGHPWSQHSGSGCMVVYGANTDGRSFCPCQLPGYWTADRAG